METQYHLLGEDFLCSRLFMTMIVIHVRKVKYYFPVVRITVFCCLVCYMLSEVLWCKCVLVFAAIVSKLEKKQKFSKCRETLIFLL